MDGTICVYPMSSLSRIWPLSFLKFKLSAETARPMLDTRSLRAKETYIEEVNITRIIFVSRYKTKVLAPTSKHTSEGYKIIPTRFFL